MVGAERGEAGRDGPGPARVAIRGVPRDQSRRWQAGSKKNDELLLLWQRLLQVHFIQDFARFCLMFLLFSVNACIEIWFWSWKYWRIGIIFYEKESLTISDDLPHLVIVCIPLYH